MLEKWAVQESKDWLGEAVAVQTTSCSAFSGCTTYRNTYFLGIGAVETSMRVRMSFFEECDRSRTSSQSALRKTFLQTTQTSNYSSVLSLLFSFFFFFFCWKIASLSALPLHYSFLLSDCSLFLPVSLFRSLQSVILWTIMNFPSKPRWSIRFLMKDSYFSILRPLEHCSFESFISFLSMISRESHCPSQWNAKWRRKWRKHEVWWWIKKKKLVYYSKWYSLFVVIVLVPTKAQSKLLLQKKKKKRANLQFANEFGLSGRIGQMGTHKKLQGNIETDCFGFWGNNNKKCPRGRAEGVARVLDRLRRTQPACIALSALVGSIPSGRPTSPCSSPIFNSATTD